MRFSHVIREPFLVFLGFVCLGDIIQSEANHYRRHDGKPHWSRPNRQELNHRPSYHGRFNQDKPGHDSSVDTSHHSRKKNHHLAVHTPNKPSSWDGPHKQSKLPAWKSDTKVNKKMKFDDMYVFPTPVHNKPTQLSILGDLQSKQYAKSEFDVRKYMDSNPHSEIAFAPAFQSDSSASRRSLPSYYNIETRAQNLEVKTTSKPKASKDKKKDDKKKKKEKKEKDKKKKHDKKKKKKLEDEKKKKKKKNDHKKKNKKKKTKTIKYKKIPVKETFHILAFQSILRHNQARLPPIVPRPSVQGTPFEWDDDVSRQSPPEVKDTVLYLSLRCKQRFKNCAPRNITGDYCDSMKSGNVKECFINNTVDITVKNPENNTMNTTMENTTNNTLEDGCSKMEWSLLESAACLRDKWEVNWNQTKWSTNAPLRFTLSEARKSCRKEFDRCRKLYTDKTKVNSYCGMLVSGKDGETCFNKTKAHCTDIEMEWITDAACTRSVVNWEDGPWSVDTRLQLVTALATPTCQKSLEACRVEAKRLSYKTTNSYCEMMEDDKKCLHEKSCTHNERKDLLLAACEFSGTMYFKADWNIILSLFVMVIFNRCQN